MQIVQKYEAIRQMLTTHSQNNIIQSYAKERLCFRFTVIIRLMLKLHANKLIVQKFETMTKMRGTNKNPQKFCS